MRATTHKNLIQEINPKFIISGTSFENFLKHNSKKKKHERLD